MINKTNDKHYINENILLLNKVISHLCGENVFEYVASLFKKRWNLNEILFFSYNEVDNSIDLSDTLSRDKFDNPVIFKLTDNDNPICFSFNYKRTYKTNSIISFSNYSGFKKIFPLEYQKLHTLSIPVIKDEEKIGVLVLLAPESVILEIKKSNHLDFINLFISFYKIIFEKKRLVENNRLLNSNLNNTYKYSYKKISESYINNTWANITNKCEFIKRDILKAGFSNLNTLVTGKEGTGKTLVTKMIHTASPNIHKPFIVIECDKKQTASRFEKEIFGFRNIHSRNDNFREIAGAIETVNDGTLVLENIDKLPASVQRQLGKLLSDKDKRPYTFKLVCTTSKELNELENKLNKKLKKIISPIIIRLPKLKDSPDGIYNLTEHFISLCERKYRKTIAGISKEAIKILKNKKTDLSSKTIYRIIEDSCNNTGFGEKISKHTVERSVNKLITINSDKIISTDLKSKIKNCESRIINNALEKTKGNVTQAAAYLGLPRRTLTYKCKKLGIHGSL